MSLTFFKFDFNRWLAGSIQLFTDAEKGTFIDLCARTMEEGGLLDYTDPMLPRKLRIDEATLCARIQAYAEADLVVCNGTDLSIKFITKQINEYNFKCEKNRQNARKRWDKKCDTMPNRIEENRIEENRIDNTEPPLPPSGGSESDYQITPAIVEDIYLAYPKQSQKIKAERAIATALRKRLITPYELAEQVKAFALAISWQEMRFIPDCHTWIESQRWTDDPATWGQPNSNQQATDKFKQESAAQTERALQLLKEQEERNAR